MGTAMKNEVAPGLQERYGLEDRARCPYGEANVSDISVSPSRHTLQRYGIGNLKTEHWNLPTSALYEEAIRLGEGQIVHLGPLVVRTGKHTGRAANDKFFVKEPSSEKLIAWGAVNQPMSEACFDRLHMKAVAYLQNRSVYVSDVRAGSDKKHSLSMRVVTETAWHALFVRNMFIRPTDAELKEHEPKFTIIHCPGLFANPETDGTNSSTFIAIHMGRRTAIIGGTHYAGEIKKTAFTAMNYYLPQDGVLTMHSAANVGKDGSSAVFFGLSGTGKTTLSADPSRELIGDDEHGWTDEGVFNIEGGCYAKVIRLCQKAEPDIFNTTRRFGTVIENAVMNPVTRMLDLSDASITENTRAAYPIQYIPNHRPDGIGGIPKTIVMLTCDAFGVLPPISRLSADQAVYWFLLGYTAKVAGTEMGVKEPTATFSACFGLPFMPLHPSVYGKLLKEKILKHNTDVWLLNTGWSGGAYGVGNRMSIKDTRQLLHCALDGTLADVKFDTHSIFNLEVPKTCEGVNPEVLNPRLSWADKEAYDTQATRLAHLCVDAFKPFESHVSAEVVSSGPVAE
jgi:phosphoenolpyruvate carboxykinase (ATP)